MRFVEMQLRCVPTDGEPANESTNPESADAIGTDLEQSTITYAGKTYRVDLPIVKLMEMLANAPFGWVASPELNREPLLENERIDRLIRKLPESIQELIDGQSGKGYRLCKNRRNAQLVDRPA
jgi:hypothetical protein